MKHSALPPSRRARSFVSIEILEARIAPATLASLAAGSISVLGDQGAAGEIETLVFTISGADLHISDATHAITAGAGFTQNGANDVLIALASFTANLTVDTGTGADTVTFNDALSLPGNATVTTGSISLPNLSSDLAAAGPGTITLTASRNITFDGGASVTTVNGNLTLSANAAGTTTGNFIGVFVDDALVAATGTGVVSVTGIGGDSGASQTGVRVEGGGAILGGTSGAVTVTGTGGASTSDFNHGVVVSGATSSIGSSGANVQVTGLSGGTGGSAESFGIYLEAGVITAGGSGSVVVQGTGGASTGNFNYGVAVAGAGGSIGSGGGSVQVTGQGGGTGSSIQNIGVFIGNAGVITAGGSGSVMVQGTGGGGTGSNTGALVTGAGSTITSGGGDVEVTGVVGAGAGAQAIQLASGASVTTAANGGSITLYANSMDLAGGSLAAPASNVHLRQTTGGTLINLGGADSAGTLGLTDAELDTITANNTIIGDVSSGAITVSAAITHANHLSLTTGAGVTFNQAATMAVNKNLTVTANGTGAGISLANTNADLAASGTGAISLTTARNIALTSGSGILTASGAITLTANAAGTTTGSFVGIDVNSATITTTSGVMSLTGRGGDAASSQSGVVVQGTAQLNSTTGTITLNGTAGGAGGSSNTGVVVSANVMSGGGDVTIIGQGGGTGAATGSRGVSVGGPLSVSVGGTGELTITGTSGAGSGGDNIGVLVLSATLSTAGGDMAITGTSGGTGAGFDDIGVVIANSDTALTAGGSGKIDITGTGGQGTGTLNAGVRLGADGSIQAANGDITITGTEGNGPSGPGFRFTSGVTFAVATTGSGNIALIANSMDIAGAGNSINAGANTVTLRPRTNGTGIDLGSVANPSAGPLSLADAELNKITAGTVQIGDANSGTITVSAAITHGNHLSITGPSITFDHRITMAVNKNLTVGVTGLIDVNGAIADLTASGTGSISLTTERRISVNSATISVADGNLTLSANQQAIQGVGNFQGINISGTVETTGTGDILIQGRGGDAGANTDGVHVGGTVRSTATGASAGSVSILGTGGADVAARIYGVNINSGLVTSVDGAISITGLGGVGGDNYGIRMASTGQVASTGTGANAATITLNGTAAAGGVGDNHGVYMTASSITSVDGDIAITALGGSGSGSGGRGVFMDSGSAVTSTGTGASAAKITMDGTGGATGTNNRGIVVGGAGSVTVSSVAGDITLTGQGGGTTTGNLGVEIDANANVVSTGTGPTAAKITIVGTSGVNRAVSLTAGSQVNSVDGDIFIQGTPGTGTLGIDASDTTLTVTGTATLTFVADTMNLGAASVFSVGTSAVTLRPLTAGRAINLGSAVDNTAGTLEFSDAELDVITAGTLNIGDANSGAITVSAAITVVPTFNIASTAATTVASGGSLGTKGSIAGPLSVSSGGSVAPGANGTGISAIGSGNLSFASGSTFTAQVNGATPVTQHDQLGVTGTVTLGGATLSTSGTITSVPGQIIRIIDNDGGDAVSGIFTGLPQSSVVTINGVDFRLSYTGGTGNDVTLTQPTGAAITVDIVSGDLEIVDGQTGGEMGLTIVRNGANLRISDAFGSVLAGVGATQIDPTTVEVPVASISAHVIVTASDGDDELTVDGSGGALGLPGDFDFLGDLGSDTIRVVNAAAGAASIAFNTSAGSGAIGVSTLGTARFTDVEDVQLLGGHDTVSIELPNTDDQAQLEDDATAGDGRMVLRSTAGSPTFPRTTFDSPINASGGELAIDLRAGADTLTLASFDSAFLPALNIATGALLDALTDTIVVNTALSLGSGSATGHLTIEADAILLNNASISTDGGASAGNVQFVGGVVLGTSVTINTNSAGGADGSIFFNATLDADSAVATRNLTLTAGTGAVAFNQTVGTVARLDNLTVTGAAVPINLITEIDGALDVTASGPFHAFNTTAASATIAADEVSIVALNVGAGTVTFRPASGTTLTVLGSPDGLGTLGFTDAELDGITAGTITFDATSAGPISVVAAITRAVATDLVFNAGASNSLTFVLGGSINANGGDVTIALNAAGSGSIVSGTASTDIFAAALTLTAGSGSIGASGNPLVFNANTLTADTSALSGPQFLREKDTVTLAGTGLSSANGGTTLVGGTFMASAMNQFNGFISLGSAVALDFAGFNQTLTDLSGAGDVALGGATLNVPQGELTGVLSGAGALNKTGGGTFTLGNSNNTFTGPVTIANGTLEVKGNGALGDLANSVTFSATTSTLATIGSFAIDRVFNIPAGMAIIEVPGGNVTFDGSLVGGALDKEGGGTLVFGTDVTGDVVVSDGSLAVDNSKLTVTGPGDIIVTIIDDGAGGTVIDQVEFIATDTTTNLVIKGPTDGSMTTINTIMSADPANEIGSIKLGPTVILGNGMDDGIADVQITGRIGTITAMNIAPNTIIELGKGLPYNIGGDETTPDSYNNKPSLKLGSVGAGTIIDVTGNGIPGNEPGSMGGGGLGKVVIASWDGPGIVKTTQSVESFTLKEGDCFIVFQIDALHHGADNMADMGNIKVARGSWGSTGSEVEGKTGKFNALGFLEGATFESGSIDKFTTRTGDFAGTVTLTEVAPAVLGSFKVGTNFTGRIDAVGPVKTVSVTGNFTGSLIAAAIGSISALSFDGATTGNTLGDPLRHDIRATDGSIGSIKTKQGGIREYEISAATVFGGFAVKQVTALVDTVGIDHVSVHAAEIGNMKVTLASPVGALLTGISNSVFASSTSIGKTTSTHSVTGTSIIAGETIGALKIGTSTVFADFTGSRLLAGVNVGLDGALGGGDDTYTRAAAIAAITITGKLATSTIASGVMPGAGGVFGDGDDIAAPGDFLAKASGTLIKALGKITLGAASGSLQPGTGGTPSYAIEGGSFTSIVLGGITTKVIPTGSVLHITGGSAAEDIALLVV